MALLRWRAGPGTKIGCPVDCRTPRQGFILIGQFDSASLALRNLFRKTLRSIAGSRSGPALIPSNSKNSALTVWPDRRDASA